MEFNSLQELKERVMPALRKKESDFHLQGINYNTEDIWFYLTKNKWMKSTNLSLNEIVNDILKLDASDLTR